MAAALIRGETVLVVDAYDTGLRILEAVDRRLPSPPQGAPHATREQARRERRAAALRLLVPIEGHRIALARAGHSGFFAELYPDTPKFDLPLVRAQELVGAWRRYDNGVHLDVLGHALHPFFGTYVPARTSHLELFGTWLAQWSGARDRAIDVGTGSGVLAWMLARAGFGQVVATDIHENAVESVRRDLERHPAPIVPHCGDLLTSVDGTADLVVFNPPWLPGRVDSPLDQALYFDDPGLFERFFAQARARLRPGGRVVVVFSDIGGLVRPDLPHPIETELERGFLDKVQVLRRRVKASHGRRTKERVEIWELAVTEAGSV